MFEIITLALSLLALPTPAVEAQPCPWLTVDLGRYEIGPKARRRACRWDGALRAQAQKRDLDPDLLRALVVVESRWRPWAVSHANACGLTQVIPKWTGGAASGRRKWSCEELKRPPTALAVGARILRWWIDYRKGDIREGLCGYNAGFRTCARAGAGYARKVLSVRDALRAAQAPKIPTCDAPSCGLSR